MILSKIDLLPPADFDVERCIAYAHRVNPGIERLRLSAAAGQGIDARCERLRRRVGTDAPAEPAP